MEDANRLGLALERRRLQLFVVEDRRRRVMGGETDRDPHLRGRRLQPSRGVDRVAGEEAFAGAGLDAEPDERLAGVDPDAGTKRCATDSREPFHLCDDPKAGAHGALGIVLVGGGHAEHSDCRVPDELLDDAAVRLDLGSTTLK